jgi:competence protein ComEA
MMTRFSWAVCLLLLLVACAAEPEPIIIETPIISATPYATPAPIPTATRTPFATSRPPATISAPARGAATARITATPPLTSTAPVVRVNINTADADALVKLPRIGAVLAGRIIAYRAAHGPFKQIEEITKVSGIGTATFNAIKELITVE